MRGNNASNNSCGGIALIYALHFDCLRPPAPPERFHGARQALFGLIALTVACQYDRILPPKNVAQAQTISTTLRSRLEAVFARSMTDSNSATQFEAGPEQ